jgi:hypothetical protein
MKQWDFQTRVCCLRVKQTSVLILIWMICTWDYGWVSEWKQIGLWYTYRQEVCTIWCWSRDPPHPAGCPTSLLLSLHDVRTYSETSEWCPCHVEPSINEPRACATRYDKCLPHAGPNPWHITTQSSHQLRSQWAACRCIWAHQSPRYSAPRAIYGSKYISQGKAKS